VRTEPKEKKEFDIYTAPKAAMQLSDSTDDAAFRRYLLDNMGLEHRKMLKNRITRLDFDPFIYNADELVDMVCHMILELGCIDHFNINPHLMRALIVEIAIGYRDVPYNNFYHGADTCQMVYFYLISTGAKEFLYQEDILALMLAGIAVDLGHPGKDNTFQIATKSTLAIQYNDTSVLENHHAAEFFRIASKPKCDLMGHLRKLGGDYATNIRSKIIEAIIATDMTTHFSLRERFRELCKRWQREKAMSNTGHIPLVSFARGELEQIFREIDADNSGEIDEEELCSLMNRLGCDMARDQVTVVFKSICKIANERVESLSMEAFIAWWQSPDDTAAAVKVAISNREHLRRKKEDRRTLRQYIIHAAQFSYPTRPCLVASKWAEIHQEELHHQGDMELTAEPRVPFSSAFNDRQRVFHHPSKLHKACIEHLVQPFFEVGEVFFDGIDEMVENTQYNKKWCDQHLEQTEEWRHENRAEITPAAVTQSLSSVRHWWDHDEKKDDAEMAKADENERRLPRWRRLVVKEQAEKKDKKNRQIEEVRDPARRNIKSAYDIYEEETARKVELMKEDKIIREELDIAHLGFDE